MHPFFASFAALSAVVLAATTPDASTGPAQTPLLSAPLQTDDDVVRALRESYTRHEYAIPMRDGVKLHTDVWVPKPMHVDDARTWPFLIVRTPYSVGTYGVDKVPDAKNHRALARFAPSPELIRSGYIFVHQDVRGRMMSEGTFVDVRPLQDPARTRAHDPAVVDESTDAWDTIDWLVKNVRGNNGRAGIWGISYPGFYAAQAAVDAHPALRAVAPMAPVTDWFLGDDFHHNGALFVADAVTFYANFGRARPAPTTTMSWNWQPDTGDIYEFFRRVGPISRINEQHLHGEIAFWNDLLAHPTRDAWWRARDPLPRYRDIKPAVLVVGGAFDAEDLWGALHTYRAMDAQTKGNRVSLVLGPWMHGGWHRSDGSSVGEVSFGQPTSTRYRNEIETPFFESHLKGDGRVRTPEAFVFITGSNEWEALPSWPPRDASPRALYLEAGGTLSGKAPIAVDDSARDAWLADPLHPVPYIGTSSSEIDKTYMTADQRFAAHRPDVVTYESPVLDGDVTLAGPVDADLWLITTGTDADVVVKLIDVWPEDLEDPEPNPTGVRRGGYQQLVRGDVMRGRFRDSFERPAPFVAGAPTHVPFTLPDVAHTFRRGHRIMVQVQSSWFPLVDSNPQSFVDLGTATAADFRAQTHALLRSAAHPSSLRLPVWRGRLPEMRPAQ